MKKIIPIIMAVITLLGAGCSGKVESKKAKAESKNPIEKPQIKIEGGRLTPEALWAMGRIGSVVSDIETGWMPMTYSPAPFIFQ